MIDQLIIGDKGSFDDFGASLSLRNIKQPKKKTVKETVPYSNKAYDFSAINGELYWEQRTLEYTFEMIAETPEELEEQKEAFSNWIMQVFEEDIHDPFIPFYHFIGTFEDIEYSDDEGLDKTTAKVTFAAYPYKVANTAKRFTFTIPAKGTVTGTVINESAHSVTPTIKTNTDILIKYENMSWAVGEGEVKDDTLMLEKGATVFTFENPKDTECTLSFSFNEEVL